MANYIAIDLGTSYSRVGVFQNGNVKIIADRHGNQSIPSFVTISGNSFVVGQEAKDQASTNTQNTIFDIKHLIGSKFNDKFVEANKKYWPFRITEDHNGYVQIETIGRRFTPEQIIAEIIKKLKQIAEDFLGHSVAEAVITIPAGFDHFQRQAIKNAGKEAGLKVIRLLCDSTAASIAYGFKAANEMEEKNILVVNIGGGFLDCTITTIENGIFEVKSVASNNHLGGEDFIDRMVNNFIAEFKRKHEKDLTSSPHALRLLLNACERAKCTLSHAPEASIGIPKLYDCMDFYSSITCIRFEEMCADLFRNILDPIEKALRDAKMDKDQIHEIVLVGGSAHIPKIQSLVSQLFSGKNLNRILNQYEAVINGATLFAASISANAPSNFNNFMLLDVAPHSIGVEINDGSYVTIIKRNRSIPIRASKTFTPLKDNQTSTLIKIFEGERAMAENNIHLATLELTGISPAPWGIPKIEIIFDIDATQNLSVTARVENGGSVTQIINNLTISQRFIADQYEMEEQCKKIVFMRN